MKIASFIASFLVSSTHETFVKENRWYCRGLSEIQSSKKGGVTSAQMSELSIKVCLLGTEHVAVGEHWS